MIVISDKIDYNMAVIALASNLKFFCNQKKFIMMTKTTPKWKIAVLKISIAPFVTAIFSLLCLKSVAQEKTTKLPNRIEVETVTNEELDSLQKADPVKYKGEREEILKTTITYNEAGSKKDSIFFNNKPKYEKPKLTSLSKISPDKIKRIEILQLSNDEKKALKEIDFEKYNDSTLVDYMAVKATFINEEGEIEAITSYEKKPNNKM